MLLFSNWINYMVLDTAAIKITLQGCTIVCEKPVLKPVYKVQNLSGWTWKWHFIVRGVKCVRWCSRAHSTEHGRGSSGKGQPHGHTAISMHTDPAGIFNNTPANDNNFQHVRLSLSVQNLAPYRSTLTLTQQNPT